MKLRTIVFNGSNVGYLAGSGIYFGIDEYD
jgi:hypothetical protein